MSQISPQPSWRPATVAAAATRPADRPPSPPALTPILPSLRSDRLQQAGFVTAQADGTAVRRPVVLPALQSVKPLPAHASVANVPLRNQLTESKNNNACGTNALWMAMAYHKGADKVDFADLNRSCRATGFDLGSSPDFLAAYAREHGLTASIHHDSTTNDLRRMIAAGLPPVILTDWHADTTPGKSLHYLVVTGYSGTDDATTRWTVHNPWGGIVETVDTPTLLKRWSNLYLKPVHTPINRLMLTLAPPDRKGELPRSNPSVGQAVTLGAVDVVTVGAHIAENVGNAVKRLGRPLPALSGMPLLPFSRF